MPRLNNKRHELFAQAVAKGKPYREAYVQAGFKSETEHAMPQLPAVLQLVWSPYPNSSDAKRSQLVTIELLTEELEDARLLAMKDERGAAAAVSAVMSKAKLHGLVIDRAKQEHSGSLTVRHEDALDQLR